MITGITEISVRDIGELFCVETHESDVANYTYYLYVGIGAELVFQHQDYRRYHEPFNCRPKEGDRNWPIVVGKDLPIFTDDSGREVFYRGKVSQITQLEKGDEAAVKDCRLFDRI
ncbi:TPA: hypothetical protein DD449_03440 [Candidatus Berkelbacteria bacterium]|uniref:Uncharacterized protein n=1 Tax=Berkelbacteria bacterium GW2011_GWE1_39_12 TaxID=1618337 RepID=A0A0G4B2M2_9BACT|nr:MAG: hypothetical protein UT28_C0001G0320 [Berkelbacteria bacterium GW2011_GWE1_39_12]HBO60711.1 hypothetical protein [Candidatus Berkelbacteria bacterium]